MNHYREDSLLLVKMMSDITYCSHHCVNEECFRNRVHIDKSAGMVSWDWFYGCENFKKVKTPEYKVKNFDSSSFKQNITYIWQKS